MVRASPLTLRGLGVLLVGVILCTAGTASGIRELLYYGVALIAVFTLAILYVWTSRRATGVQRVLSTDIARVGERSLLSAVVEIGVVLPTPAGTWADELPQALSGESAGVLPALTPGGPTSTTRVTLAYEVTGVRRGVTSIGPLRLSGTDPFGLVRRSQSVGARTDVTVGPELVRLPPLTFLAGEAGGVLNTATSQYGEGADDLIARPYAPGDSMRRIHWRATAHRDELMVRQEEQETTPEASVVLDLFGGRWGANATGTPGSDPAFERGVSMAASAAAHLVSEGYLVRVVDSDGRELADPLHGDEDVADLSAHLAVVHAQHDDVLGHLRPLLATAMSGPLILVLGRCGDEERALLRGVASHSTFPVLITDASEADLDDAHAMGWHVGRLGSGVRAAWVEATEGRPTHAGA